MENFEDKFFIDDEAREKYFGRVAGKYETTRPIHDSIVRLDQEAKIAETLRSGRPVLIRGNWRIGKTSMILSLRTHQFGPKNSIIINAMEEIALRGEPIEVFQELFGVYRIAKFIAERELTGAEPKERKVDEIIKQIEESQKFPFKFLNDYLVRRGEKVFLSLDEVIVLAEQPEKLEYLARLRDLSNIQLAIVLHRIARLERLFEEIFGEYETHFVRPLTLEEVGVLVRKPLEGTQITFTDDAIQRIFEFTGGRPMEINSLCSALTDPLSKDSILRLTYRGEDIDALTRKETWQLRYSLGAAIITYNQVYRLSLSDEERAIIDRLIKGEVPISEIDAREVKPLIDTTLVVKDESRGIYRVNGDLFKRVVSERNL